MKHLSQINFIINVFKIENLIWNTKKKTFYCVYLTEFSNKFSTEIYYKILLPLLAMDISWVVFVDNFYEMFFQDPQIANISGRPKKLKFGDYFGLFGSRHISWMFYLVIFPRCFFLKVFLDISPSDILDIFPGHGLLDTSGGPIQIKIGLFFGSLKKTNWTLHCQT